MVASHLVKTASEVAHSPRAIPSLVDVVILSGDIGRKTPWTCGIPLPLLPLSGHTLIEALLTNICRGSTSTCTVCTDGATDPIEEYVRIIDPLPLRLGFHTEPVPRGSAGCLKGCASHFDNNQILVVGDCVWLEDDASWLVEQHVASGNSLTLFCSRDSVVSGRNTNGCLRPAGVFCCDPIVLEHIPEVGYRDIREQLVPALRNAGLRVGAVVLEHGTCEVTDWVTYIRAIEGSLTNGRPEGKGFHELAPDVWCGSGVEIASSSRIVGPALVGHGCKLDDDTLVIGPSIIGNGSHIEAGSWLLRTVTTDSVWLPPKSAVADRIVDAPNSTTTNGTFEMIEKQF